MAVQDCSFQYEYNFPFAVKCRDCIDGEETIKAKGREYLPGLEGSDSDNDVNNAYNAYLSRALYYNTVGRTKNFLKGLVIRNPVKPNIPDGMKDFMKDVDGEGMNFYNFSTMVLDEVLSVGYGGILVDHDEVPEDILTKKEAKEKGYRVKMTWYPMESLFNSGKNIRLHQEVDVEIDEFTSKVEERILVLDLDESGYYRQRIYVKEEENKKKRKAKVNWIQKGNDRYPTMNGSKMKFIPFYPCGADSNSFEISKPPLLDLANVSLHHFGVYADYRNGIHFTGFPQLYVAGHKDDGQKLRMGSGVAWEFEDSSAVVKYAEFTGKGLEHPEKLLNKLEEYMSKLGARMLMVEKRTAESADKVRQDSSSESSLLAGIANNVSDVLSAALEISRQWMDVSGKEIIVELNTDYDIVKIDPSLMIALMKAVQANLITIETFMYNLNKGELLNPERSIDEEIKALLKQKEKLDDLGGDKDLDAEGGKSNNPLSERNKSGLKDPSDETRDEVREKTDYST